MATIRAVRYDAFGPPSVLRIVNEPPPQRRAGQVLVEVRTASVNPVDVKTRRQGLGCHRRRRRHHHPHNCSALPVCSGAVPRFVVKLPKVPGGDLAGVVVEADEGKQHAADSCQRMLICSP